MFNFGRDGSTSKNIQDTKVKLVPINTETVQQYKDKSKRDLGIKTRHSKSTITLPSIKNQVADSKDLENTTFPEELNHDPSTPKIF